MSKLANKYNFLECEKKWQKTWQEDKTYSWDCQEHVNSFVIDTPPPTISGNLHMGHIFSYTQTDLIARFQRMQGKNVFYPIGFDDNGLPTERLVEKVKNIKATQVDVNEFQKLCEEVSLSSIEKFRALFQDMGMSYDWEQEYRTISPSVQKISQMSFLDLAKKGQVYRKSQPILWDPADSTALAQADIEDKIKESFMNDIEFSLEDGNKITIATTRPELLAACVAIFFNPKDERYKHLNNLYAITPLFFNKVPIIADDKVDICKGTGLVMCCTFGDMTDIEWWKKYKLPAKIILDKFGKITNLDLSDSLSEKEAMLNASYITGLKALQAREKIIEILKEKNYLRKQTPITHAVKCAERSGAALEIITTNQWFIKILDHKENLLKKAAEINWHPAHMKHKIDSWINSLNWDWCISRQRFMGVRFPVWYSKRQGEEGKVIFAEFDQLPVNPSVDLPRGYSREEVIADTDVMDTWATSSISPQINSHGISNELFLNEERHRKLFPADLRPQAHEIIRSWAFYTIVKSYLHQETKPWKNIMISGWCLASDKTKMSKSKGNIVSPEDLIKTYGADVIRFWAAGSKLGADTAFSEDLLSQGKRLINKIWNAAKFLEMHLENHKEFNPNLDYVTEDSDLWILSKANQLIENASEELSKFEYSSAKMLIENFFWKDFCDNYLEIIKVRIYSENYESALSALYFSFRIILKLFAVFIPYITEEINEALYQEKSLHVKGSWPKKMAISCSNEILNQSQNMITILEIVRRIKALKNLSIKAEIKRLEIETSLFKVDSQNLINDLQNVINARSVNYVNKFSNDLEIFVEDDMKIGIEFSVN